MSDETTPLTPALHAFQRFETRDIRRSEIANGGYNPRRISSENKARLRASIEQFGLVEPPVWNKRSGNQVGSHQRLSILDTLAEEADYLLTVAVVDLSPEEEKALNITLNARGAQGEYDSEKLESLLAELEGQIDIDLADLLGDTEKALKKLTAPKKKQSKQTLDATYEIVIKCADENEQRVSFEKLVEEGYNCRVLVL